MDFLILFQGGKEFCLVSVEKVTNWKTRPVISCQFGNGKVLDLYFFDLVSFKYEGTNGDEGDGKGKRGNKEEWY